MTMDEQDTGGFTLTSHIDITNALRLLSDAWAEASPNAIIHKAIAEIERLRRENQDLQAKLEQLEQ
jgi:ubiquinone biosynthesis protein UbiJ